MEGEPGRLLPFAGGSELWIFTFLAAPSPPSAVVCFCFRLLSLQSLVLPSSLLFLALRTAPFCVSRHERALPGVAVPLGSSLPSEARLDMARQLAGESGCQETLPLIPHLPPVHFPPGWPHPSPHRLLPSSPAAPVLLRPPGGARRGVFPCSLAMGRILGSNSF